MLKKTLFSVREVRALVWLLPVLAVVSWLVCEIARPSHNNLLPSVKTDGRKGDTKTVASARLDHWAKAQNIEASSNPSAQADGNDNNSSAENNNSDGRQTPSVTRDLAQLFPFDPNTIGYHDLVRLGFSRGEALGIVKYRERGKVFEIPEDFAACYQVSEEMYRRLESYIKIGEQFRLKPFDWAEARNGDAVSYPSVKTDGNTNTGLNDSDAGNNNPDGFGRQWKENSDDSLSPSPDASPALADGSKGNATHKGDLVRRVELNSADSAALISISGIGPKTLKSITDYRRRLGGFVCAEQLAEVSGVTEQNYERIVTQIYVDSLAIQKIDINFADAKLLGQHPYIHSEQLRKLLKLRQLKGGWNNTGQLTEDKIFTPSEAEKLAPYLLFRQHPR